MPTKRAGSKVRAARLERGIGQGQLAAEAGISRQALSAIEAGAYTPNVTAALRLAQALGKTVESLFADAGFDSVTAVVMEEEAARRWAAGTHVGLARVGGRLIAVPRPAAGLSLLAAGGLVEQLSPEGKARVASFRTAAEIDTTLLAAGCDPAVAVMSDYLAHRTPFVELVSCQCSSSSALDCVASGRSHVGGTHLRDPGTGQYNVAAVRRKFGRRPVMVINFARWELGLASRPGARRITAIADLARPGVRIVNRQQGSGARIALDETLAEIGVEPGRLTGYESELGGHLEVAEEIAAGRADAGLTLRVAADAFGLSFTTLREERYDLVIPRRETASSAVKALLEALSSSRLASEVSRLCFYDTSEMGKVLAEIG
ncbi:MAG TPA: substrate-binding domain-containing protein [Candidatus Binataceae bacterium]|jgi:putative molybdopterin biosynthesis protein|nr:substrate-binding domain-containing protein [Candidatus Binataceae bacterium]